MPADLIDMALAAKEAAVDRDIEQTLQEFITHIAAGLADKVEVQIAYCVE